MCYDHSALTVEELKRCIANQQEECSLVDTSGMTPFHVFSSNDEPNMELLNVLLDSLSNQIRKEVLLDPHSNLIRKRIKNWTDETGNLLHRTFQKWAIDPLARWGNVSWMEGMQGRVQEILTEDDE